MYQVSKSYKESMKNPLRNRSYFKVVLGLINQEAQMSAYVDSVEEYAGYSDLDRIFETSDVGTNYATYEQDFWPADGSMIFLPRSESDYIKNFLVTDEFASSETIIVFKFGYGSSDIRGLTIRFTGNYPSKFTVITSDGTEYDFENDSLIFETETVFSNTSEIKIRINEMSIPNNRVRISYVKFGLGLEYDNEWIKTIDSSRYASPISEELPEIDFVLNLKNEDQIFNVDNPSSEINFLESGQNFGVMCGYELDDGSIEWMNLHTLFVSEWSANDDTATIKAVDRFKFMEDSYYKGKYYPDGISLYDLALDVLSDAEIYESECFLDSYLKEVYVKNPLPNVSHKEALQIIANAGRCILDYDRNGKISLHHAFTPDFETESNGTVYYSDVTAIDKNTKKNEYATYEEAYWSADGSALFVPREGIQNTGYVSSQISDEDGLFTENPIITRTLNATYKSYGMLINFSGNLPKNFQIRTYLSDELLDDVEISSGIQESMEISYEFQEFDKIEIEFKETEPNSRIHIDYISLGSETDYRIEYGDMFTTPVGTQLEKIKNIKVTRTIYSNSETEEELSSDTITYYGENQIYYFSDPSYGYSVSLEESTSGKTATIVESGCYFVELSFSGFSVGDEIKTVIKGKKYNLSTSVYSEQIYNRGSDKEWINPLVSDYEHSVDLCKWLKDYYASGVEYELDYRGEPAIDPGDVIYQENKYNDELKVVVLESQLSFNGAISGGLLTRRLENVVRTKNGLG